MQNPADELPDSIWQKELTCPNCGNVVADPRPKRGSYQVGSQDTDFYKNFEGENPYYYRITVCPSCYFAFETEEFEDVLISDQRGLESMLGGLDEYRGHDFTVQRELDAAIAAHELALGSAVFIEDQFLFKGRINLRTSWLYRELAELEGGDYEERRTALLEDALELFQTSYREERLEDRSLSGPALGYLIGELHRRLGHFDAAVRWFGQVVNAGQVSPRIEGLARDQWNRAREQKRSSEGGGGQLREQRSTERAVFTLYRDQIRWLKKVASRRDTSSSELLREELDKMKERIEE